MSAIDEMYEKYGICGRCIQGTLCNTGNGRVEKITYYSYPPFTAEKQLEILKTIGLLGNVCITKREYNDMWCITTHHKNGIGQDLVFEEALSKWITNIYDSLSVTMQNKVKEILER